MTSPFVAIGFGLVLISMLFLVLVFYRAYRDPDVLLDRRYRVVASALMVGSAGVAIWTINPLSQSLGGPPLNGWALFVASALIFAAAAALIGSTVLNGSRTTVIWFMSTSIIWSFGCLFWYYVV